MQRVGASGISAQRVGSVRVGSVRVGSERVGSVRVGSVRVGSVRVGMERVERVGSVRVGSLCGRRITVSMSSELMDFTAGGSGGRPLSLPAAPPLALAAEDAPAPTPSTLALPRPFACMSATSRADEAHAYSGRNAGSTGAIAAAAPV